MKNIIKYSLVLIAGCILFASCNKKEYLIDGGLHDPKTPLSTYDYLKQHPWQLFDTLIILVDNLNMKEELNQAGTMFGVTDFSIKTYMNARQTALRQINENLVYNLDSLKKDIKADSLRQYLFSEKITLSNVPLNPEVQVIKSKGNTQCAFSKVHLTSNQGHNYLQFTTAPVYSLFYTSVRGALDVPGVTPPAGEADIRVQCQTTGIETSSGTTLHVLVNQHTFTRF